MAIAFSAIDFTALTTVTLAWYAFVAASRFDDLRGDVDVRIGNAAFLIGVGVPRLVDSLPGCRVLFHAHDPHAGADDIR